MHKIIKSVPTICYWPGVEKNLNYHAMEQQKIINAYFVNLIITQVRVSMKWSRAMEKNKLLVNTREFFMDNHVDFCKCIKLYVM